MKTLNNTGIPKKNSGDGLSHNDINRINTAVNDAIDALNELAKDYGNANIDSGDLGKRYSLSEAISKVPINQRQAGYKIKFLSNSGVWLEYVFSGSNPSEWDILENWNTPIGIIDGGEW